MSELVGIKIEGSLIAQDILDAIDKGETAGQKPKDFGLSRPLIDECAAALAAARKHWEALNNLQEAKPEPEAVRRATRTQLVLPLFSLLGYDLTRNEHAYDCDGVKYHISHRADKNIGAPPVCVVSYDQPLGNIDPNSRPRRSPHGLLQEFLNRHECLWGIVTNGRLIRALRDSALIRRQAYIEFDLDRILGENRLREFMLLYRLLHRSRLPKDEQPQHECLIDAYFQQSAEQGNRVREKLREGVKECMIRLANGFLRHPANDQLCQNLKPADFYAQLLKVVYRLLFLLVAEERRLMGANSLYYDHYGVGRLRRKADRFSPKDEHADLWLSLKALRAALCDPTAAQILGCSALNGELFAEVPIDNALVCNSDLLAAFRQLCWYRDRPNQPEIRVNYAALDVEELGSVYESLLDYHPDIVRDAAGRPKFELRQGDERKSTGSYYTPPQLVNELVKSALEPVIQERLQHAGDDKEAALLAIRVCDPACGSGHFLLAAARRLGKELARIRTNEEEPSPEASRQAVREVIARCIYGVDKNKLAVDLCRVALWIEGHAEDKPLGFLEHRIRHGDSLVGVFDLQCLEKGIPSEAFKSAPDGDKAVVKMLLNQNKSDLGGQAALFNSAPDTAIETLAQTAKQIDALPDDTPQTVQQKKALYEQSHADRRYARLKEACDLWTAAFFQSFNPNEPSITTGTVRDRMADNPPETRIRAWVATLAASMPFFHWPIEFPEVFESGGFDVLLSNPPWERTKLQEQEFFAPRDSAVANAPNASERAKLIKALQQTNPALYAQFQQTKNLADRTSWFLRKSQRFPFTGKGDINTYAVFAELARNLRNPAGCAGVIVPTGIATDFTAKEFFQELMRSNDLRSLYDFENRKGIFPGIHRCIKFCLLTLGAPPSDKRPEPPQFAFFAHSAEDLQIDDKRIALTAEDLDLLNPNTGNCPVFRTRKDAELTKVVYRRIPVLKLDPNGDRPAENSWNVKFRIMFNMANDSGLFRTADQLRSAGFELQGNRFVQGGQLYRPLYEAKMIHQFDHRWATHVSGDKFRDVTEAEKRDPNFVVLPRYWVSEEETLKRIPQWPPAVALALQEQEPKSLRTVMALWALGYWLMQNNEERKKPLAERAEFLSASKPVQDALGPGNALGNALGLNFDYPLTEHEANEIENALDGDLKPIAQRLVRRFSPQWLMGWRDVTNATNERCMIATPFPLCAVSNTLTLIIQPVREIKTKIGLFAVLVSHVHDFCAKLNMGGTHMSFFIISQLPIPRPDFLDRPMPHDPRLTYREWLTPRVLELTYTAWDMEPFARDLGYDGPPFPWDPERRFQFRCELDAAFFHLYLPCDAKGAWIPARIAEGAVRDETDQEFGALTSEFPTPRCAVEYILEQFPIVKREDEAAHGSYRTKERILQIYDQMLSRFT